MTSDEDYDRQYEEMEQAQNIARPIIDRAERAYTQSLNGVWLGNAGAAVTTLSFIGVVAKDDATLSQRLQCPLAFFVFGLIAMGIGAAISLVQQSARAKRLERVTSILKIRVGDIKSPTEEAGLSLRDWRTILACLGAALFVMGCVVGLFDLSNSN